MTFKYAARRGHLEIVNRLLAHDKINDYMNIDPRQFIYSFREAARRGHLEILNTLLAYNKFNDDMNIDSRQFIYAFRDAARRGHLEIVNRLLAHEKINDYMNIDSRQFIYAFREAANNQHSDIVNRLLQIPSINFVTNYNNLINFKDKNLPEDLFFKICIYSSVPLDKINNNKHILFNDANIVKFVFFYAILKEASDKIFSMSSEEEQYKFLHNIKSLCTATSNFKILTAESRFTEIISKVDLIAAMIIKYGEKVARQNILKPIHILCQMIKDHAQYYHLVNGQVRANQSDNIYCKIKSFKN